VTCAISWARCSLIGLLVVMSVVVVLVLLLFSFPVDGVGVGVGGVPIHLFFVVCYCFLYWIGCVLSTSAIMKSDLSCSAVTVWVLRRAYVYTVVLLTVFVRRLSASSCSSWRASVPV